MSNNQGGRPAYYALKEQHETAWRQLTTRHNYISAIRLLVALGFIAFLYDYFRNDRTGSLWGALAAFVLFLIFINIHDRISWNRKVRKALVDINEDELQYLERSALPLEDGAQYIPPFHAYARDLDIFGKNSLFQHLNRTATWIGKTRLAELLCSALPNEHAPGNQLAVKELAQKIEWRQQLLALAKLTGDNREAYTRLMAWAKAPVKPLSALWVVLSYLSPITLLVVVILAILTRQSIYGNLTTTFFLLNLGVLVVVNKQIRQELLGIEKVSDIIRLYSLLIGKIEAEHFDSPALKALKSKLAGPDDVASAHIKKLSGLFSGLESIQNGLAAILFNGFLLYHVHVLRSLLRWKKQHSAQIPEWLDVIGAFETLNSLANFSYNNPAFAFPELNDRQEIAFRDLGHPLIAAEKRICNTVDFNAHPFMILTGSNMSGKSTFLRTLGINMVLAGIGAPVCAADAKVHPLQVWVSMSLSDSLSDNESYFFAEVRRLKTIMDALNGQACFVLLDEILRGTNSDDKRSGTLGVIKKMVEKKAIGAIATHDLEVCLITNEYPHTLTNQCFEVEIINNDLVFDYKLRSGICKNKSATFLMKKMGVVSGYSDK